MSEALTRVSIDCDLNEVTERLKPEAARQSFIETLQAYIGGLESQMRMSESANQLTLTNARNREWLPT